MREHNRLVHCLRYTRIYPLLQYMSFIWENTTIWFIVSGIPGYIPYFNTWHSYERTQPSGPQSQVYQDISFTSIHVIHMREHNRLVHSLRYTRIYPLLQYMSFIWENTTVLFIVSGIPGYIPPFKAFKLINFFFTTSHTQANFL